MFLYRYRQSAGVPISGAQVILDDADWRAWLAASGKTGGFQWTASNALMYAQKEQGGWRLVKRQLTPTMDAAPPEALPMKFTPEQVFRGVSPDGKLVLCENRVRGEKLSFTLTRTDGQGKPLRIPSAAANLLWSPDSRYLYGLAYRRGKQPLERHDVRTGTHTTTFLSAPLPISLRMITPEGKLLTDLQPVPTPSGSNAGMRQMTEIRGSKLVTTKYPFPSFFAGGTGYLSPDGRKVLWWVSDQETRFVDRWAKMGTGEWVVPHPITRWRTAHFDGSHPQEIGVSHNLEANGDSIYPFWTPDSKGIYFVYNDKLWYRAVP